MLSEVCVHCQSISFFFFQAEDGIRDRDVTGVQTCALPILGADAGGGGLRHRADHYHLKIVRQPKTTSNLVVTSLLALAQRSEERRVGKECRSRWSPDQ